MNKAFPPRRPPRLAIDVYSHTGDVFSVTIGTKGRAPVFAERRVAAAAVGVLKTHAVHTKVVVYAYCFMPDHVHLVLTPSSTCDIITFVGQLKNLVQRAAWKLGIVGAFWQTSFHDHALRFSDQLDGFVLYVLNNPIRQGLAAKWTDYPFSGSLVFTVEVLAALTEREPPHYLGRGGSQLMR